MSSILKREFYYRWTWQLQASPEALWPYVSDTNRFNRDTGVPSVEQRADDASRLSNARRHLRLYRFGVPIEWFEEPFEWIRPYRYGVTRRYVTGPVAELRIVAQLTPQPGGGTQLVYEVWARPRNLFGLIAIPAQIGVIGARSFDATFRRYDRMARDGSKASPLIITGHTQFPPGGRERLTALRQALLDMGADANLVAKLVDLIENADDLTLAQVRPYVLADHWGVPRRALLELCLYATRVGLLEMRWWLLCPLCRGPRQRSTTLGDVRSQVHCETCNIDFTVNFERSVELVFQPNPAVRQSEVREFCVAGPQVTPHIVLQQLLPPGAQRELSVPLDMGRHRLRALELPGGQALLATANGVGEVTLRASDDGWPNDEQQLSPTPKLRLDNTTEREQLFILERMAWTDQAATAADVTVLQTFRDLFANEALRPGERISVGSLAILFTDLRESTRLYREAGDAVAFGYVMNHFDVLRHAIDAEGGALVKTIGDAVMGVFRRPAAALRAILRAQHALASPTDGTQPLMLKAGIHYGTCVAVTLNDKLDYFGSTVNITARLEQFSSGGDVILSAAVRNDPEVTEMLAAPQNNLRVEPFETTLKGYEGQSFELWRVRPMLTGSKADQPERALSDHSVPDTVLMQEPQ